ncbi:MAG: MTH1187 family thiamine-binding protein [Candidatus Thermoplasmatota archaeon]
MVIEMLAEFSTYPVGVGASLSRHVAKAMGILKESKLPYKVNPMGTVVEGEWDEVMDVIKRCHMAMFEEGERVATYIKIDDRKGRTHALQRKIESLQELLDFELPV